MQIYEVHLLKGMYRDYQCHSTPRDDVTQCPYLDLHPSTIKIFHSAMSHWEQGSPPEFYRLQNQQANPTQQQMPTPIIRRITSIPTTPAKKPPAPPKVCKLRQSKVTERWVLV